MGRAGDSEYINTLVMNNSRAYLHGYVDGVWDYTLGGIESGIESYFNERLEMKEYVRDTFSGKNDEPWFMQARKMGAIGIQYTTGLPTYSMVGMQEDANQMVVNTVHTVSQMNMQDWINLGFAPAKLVYDKGVYFYHCLQSEEAMEGLYYGGGYVAGTTTGIAVDAIVGDVADAGRVADKADDVADASRIADRKTDAIEGGAPTNTNQYCLSGEEHFEAYKEMFGAENVEWTSRDTLSSADRLRIQDWAYPPTDELYLKYKDVYQNDLYFNQATGKVNWPNYDGFVPESINYETLREGTQFVRIGEPSGEFLGTTTDSFGKRSLAPFSDPSITSTPVNYYELLDDTEFLTGDIAPWFDFEGGGKQFLVYKPDGTKYTVQELLDADILKDITDQVKKGEIILDTSIK